MRSYAEAGHIVAWRFGLSIVTTVVQQSGARFQFSRKYSSSSRAFKFSDAAPELPEISTLLFTALFSLISFVERTMIVQGRSIPPVSSFGWKCWRCFLRERRALRHAPEFQHHRSLHAAKALRNGRTALQRAFRGSREGQSLLHNVSSLNYQTREFALSAYHRVEVSNSNTCLRSRLILSKNQSIPSSLSPDLVNYENLSNSDQFESGYGIRQHLVEWQKQHGQQNIDIPLPFDSQGDAASTNDSMRLRGHNENRVSDDSDLPEREDPVPFEVDEETTGRQYEYLNPGDLVELP